MMVYLVLWAYLLSSIVINACDISKQEFSILYDIYTSTKGANWVWKSPYSTFGIPWDFISSLSDPCRDKWQGIVCHTNCLIQDLRLIEMNLNGFLPNSLGYFENITSIVISRNIDLIGTIPSTISLLTTLDTLIMTETQLNGTIPFAIQSLSQLKHLALSENLFTGTIPLFLQDFNHLKQLDFFGNKLSGIIPNIFMNLTSLEILFLQSNQLIGPLPASIYQLPNIRHLTLYSNQLTGTISSNISQLTHLIDLELNNNYFTGTIPSSIGQLINLKTIYLVENLLTGTLPASLSQLTTLIELELQNNLLTSSIPESFSQLVDLRILFLSNNLLTSSIPDIFYNWTHIHTFSIFNNMFTNQLPYSLGKLSQLKVLAMYSNQFTGSVPSFYANLTALTYCLFANNYLTGSISNDFQQWTHLNSLELNQNYFTSSIPNIFDSWLELQYVNLQNNLLTQVLPSSLLQYASHMILLDLHNNHLIGSYDMIVTDLHTYTTTNTTTNQTTLQYLSLSNNCFQGSISSSYCLLSNLSYLYLNGLHSNPACQSPYFPGISSSYVLTNAIHGTIPSCLWELPQMIIFQASGNGFSGNLPSNITLSSTWTSLSLSHNLMTGHIPIVFQTYSWMLLDLSFNKFSGVLTSNYSLLLPSNNNNNNNENQEYGLNLQENRFSGHIPTIFQSITTISLNILRGNMYICQSLIYSNDNQLPSQDPYHQFYQCGSNKTNQSLYLWLILLGFILFLTGTFFCLINYSCFNWIKYQIILYFSPILIWLNIFLYLSPQSNSSPQYSILLSLQQTIFSIFYMLCQLIFIVSCLMIPINSIFSQVFPMYTYEYAWIVSSVYLSGLSPAIVYFCLLFVGLFCFQYYFVDLFKLTSNFDTQQKDSNETNQINITMDKTPENKLSSQTDLEQPQEQETKQAKTEVYLDELINERSDHQLQQPQVSIENLHDLNQLTHNSSSSPNLQQLPESSTSSHKFTRKQWNQLFICFLIFIFNIICIIIANMFYVYYVSSQTSTSINILTTICISLFKFFWLQIMIYYYTNNWFLIFDTLFPQYSLRIMSLFILILINNVIGPLFAMAMISSECFYYLFTSPSSILSYESECSLQLGVITECHLNTNQPIEFLPPYSYSYQCSSSLLTNYADVIIYRYVFSGFIFAGYRLIRMCLRYQHLKPLISLIEDSKQNDSLKISVESEEPSINPIQSLPTPQRFSQRINSQPSVSISRESEMITFSKDHNLSSSQPASSTISSAITNQQQQFQELLPNFFSKERFILGLLGDLTMILSFGMIFPPISYVVGFAMTMDFLFLGVNIGQYCYFLQDTSKYSSSFYEYINNNILQIQKDWNHIIQYMYDTLFAWMYFPVLLIWALVVFDMAGDKIGIVALVFFVLILCFPCLYLLLHRLNSRIFRSLFI